ncbi:hypothetical protein MFUM_720016 [Methylacidiphilum fumariolicum SolV]|uniref:Uncharacterized protein n=2 Tax=Candidatus Methylacidiphilum fumarolicum TaxID=591154 RepID=I0JZI2_METFB|nr:conserved protein of unknown function [Candidatus Methylacidiphilum fumarolicum]CCG92651.1 hypothetical protein MFUM_720016 [Methylacidiphilum fumariolicum SolV]
MFFRLSPSFKGVVHCHYSFYFFYLYFVLLHEEKVRLLFNLPRTVKIQAG